MKRRKLVQRHVTNPMGGTPTGTKVYRYVAVCEDCGKELPVGYDGDNCSDCEERRMVRAYVSEGLGEV